MYLFLYLYTPTNHKIISYMSFGLPGPLQTTFELTNKNTSVNKYARRGYTNVTLFNQLKYTQNIKLRFRIFSYFQNYIFFKI